MRDQKAYNIAMLYPHSSPLASSMQTEFDALPPNDEIKEKKSKTQRKRDMLALQTLAGELCLLPKERLLPLPLTDTLRDALVETNRVRSHEGKRRQMQYLGKLMRSLDEDTITAIHQAIEQWHGTSKVCTAQLHHLEHWRTALLADDAAMTRLLNDYPHADAQALRTLVRNARKELAQNKPPHCFRELFRTLKQLEQPPRPLDLSPEAE